MAFCESLSKMPLWKWKLPFGSKYVDFIPPDKGVWILSVQNLDHEKCIHFIQKFLKSAGLQDISYPFSWDKQMLLERNTGGKNLWPWHTHSCLLPADSSKAASSSPLFSLRWLVYASKYCTLLTEALGIIIQALFVLQIQHMPWKNSLWGNWKRT